jgi:acetolactate synthase regulatory subunit
VADTGNVASDYWEQQFREADERAALLAEATVAELIDIYHASGEDFDLSSICFGALQRRPSADVLAAATVERRARTVARRGFGATQISIAAHSAEQRAANLPLLMAMLEDRSSGVAARAMTAIQSVQTAASGAEFGRRLRTKPENVPAEGWPPMPAAVDLAALTAFVRHRSWDVRDALARVPWLCGEPEALDLLFTPSRDADRYVRGTAANMLGMRRITGGPLTGVLERLREMAATDVPDAKYDALASLVELGDIPARSQVVAELAEALDRGLRPFDRYQLVHLLYKEPSLVSDELRARLATEWCIDFQAQVPSELMRDV